MGELLYELRRLIDPAECRDVAVTGTTDTIVGGTARTWAQIPYVEPTNNAMIVVRGVMSEDDRRPYEPPRVRDLEEHEVPEDLKRKLLEETAAGKSPSAE